MGLPQDRLSASIISFARFFSLPLEPSLLAHIRRQALRAGNPGPSGASQGHSPLAPERSETPFLPEGTVCAAAAAIDKGVELSPGGLLEYASAIDPEQQGSGGQDRGSGKQAQEDENPDAKGRKADNAALIAADPLRLKDTMLEAGERNPLLDLLNRLPGRNGQRWIVLPFSFTANGGQYRLSLSVLLEPQGDAGRMSLEIVRTEAETPARERRWLCALDRTGGLQAQLRLGVWPARAEGDLQALAVELAAAMELPPDRVSVQNQEESFYNGEENAENVLRSVNEQV
jgi:hypothetical protein